MAAGGVGMTTVAYCAVSPEGAGRRNEMILTPRRVPGLRRLADAVHAEGAAVSAQIGHAGPVAAGTGHRAVSPSPFFSPHGHAAHPGRDRSRHRAASSAISAPARRDRPSTQVSTPSRSTSATAICPASS